MNDGPYPFESDPPVPPAVSANEDEHAGQNVLSLLKTFEKEKSTIVLRDLVALLRRIVSHVARRGILGGENGLAEKISAIYSPNGQSKEGKKQGNKNSNRSSLKSDLPALASSSLDVGLLFTAILRILRGKSPDFLLVALASDLTTAASEFVERGRDSLDTCIKAEYDLLVCEGKAILGALEHRANSLLGELQERCGLLDDTSDQDQASHGLKSCVRAISSLVGLLGTKLARSSSLRDGLVSVSHRALAVTNSEVVQSSATLMAVFPFAGGLDKVTPGELWVQQLKKTISSIWLAFSEFAPVGKLRKKEKINASDAHEYIVRWVTIVSSSSSEVDKNESFMWLLRSLVQVLLRTLTVPITDTSLARGISPNLDFSSLLDIAEFLMSFPISAETTYFTTKKRLRVLPMENGPLSPAFLVERAANEIKGMGARILKHSIAFAGGPNTMKFAKRIHKISHDALQASLSTPLRGALESAPNFPVESKRQRWLHNSLIVRREVVLLFQYVMIVLGCETATMPVSLTKSNVEVDATNTEKSVKMIVGNIIELRSSGKTPDRIGWTSYGEHRDLLCTCLAALTSCLTNGGEFLSLETRSLVDSIGRECLVTLTDPQICSPVKVAVVDFLVAEIATPWIDGSASQLVSELRQVCESVGGGNDIDFFDACTRAVRICSSFSCSRAPAIVIPRRIEKPTEVPSTVRHNLHVAVQRTRDILSATNTEPKKRVGQDGNGESATFLKKPRIGKKNSDATVPKGDGELPMGATNESQSTRRTTEVNMVAALPENPNERKENDAEEEELAVEEDFEDFPAIVDSRPDANDL